MAKVQVAQINVPEGWIDFGIGQPHVDILPLARRPQHIAIRHATGQC
jgi:hypothetical protein